MVRAEQKPGRRRAEPQRRFRRKTQPKPPPSAPVDPPPPAEEEAPSAPLVPSPSRDATPTTAPVVPRPSREEERSSEPVAPLRPSRDEEPPSEPVVPRRPSRDRKPSGARVTARSPRPSRTGAALSALLKLLWFALLGAGLGAVLLPWVPVDVPEYVRLGGAVTITTLFTHGLAVRSGGRPLISGALALVLGGAAAVSQIDVLLAGAAVGTAVVSAILAVLATTPAARFGGVIREIVVATGVAVIGAFAVRAYEPAVSLERTGYLVIGFSLLGALALVYRLGAGLQGLGRRGLVMILGGVVLLTVTLAYTAALARWGSPGVVEGVDSAFEQARDAVGAVPRPIEVLLGFPALAWGVSTRARRRQGWWVCAFGAPGLSVVAVSLLDYDLSLAEAGLTLLYSLALGLLVGYAIIRADLFLTGARGRRARQLEEQAAHRPEPGRLQALL